MSDKSSIRPLFNTKINVKKGTHFKELQEKYSNERIETVGPKLRAMFSWNKDGVKDADEANSFTGKIARAQVQ